MKALACINLFDFDDAASPTAHGVDRVDAKPAITNKEGYRFLGHHFVRSAKRVPCERASMGKTKIVDNPIRSTGAIGRPESHTREHVATLGAWPSRDHSYCQQFCAPIVKTDADAFCTQVLFKPLANLSSPLVLGAPRPTSGWKAVNRK
jgi:hypothetical protein